MKPPMKPPMKEAAKPAMKLAEFFAGVAEESTPEEPRKPG